MRALLQAFIAGVALSWSTIGVHAQAVNATCNDGSMFNGATRRGACSRHGGVKTFDPTAPVAAPTAAPGTVPALPPPTGNPPPQPGPRPAALPSSGQVWVNLASKVYHCQGDRYYGKTRSGSYMTEAAAKADGDRPSRGKVCS